MVQTDEIFANQEQVLSADPIFHQAIEITKQNLRVSSMNKPIAIDQLKSVPKVGSMAAGKNYVGNKRDNNDKAVSRLSNSLNMARETRRILTSPYSITLKDSACGRRNSED